MTRYVVVMRSIGYVHVYDASSPEEALLKARELPVSEVQLVSPFEPEVAFEIPAPTHPRVRPVADGTPKKKGRKPTTVDRIPDAFFPLYDLYVSRRINVAQLARECGISRPTAYKYIRMLKEASDDEKQ